MRRTPRPIGAPGRQPGARSRAARVRPRRSFSRARASRLRSVPPGHRSRARRLVEREALEVAEHDRQAEGARQAIDLAMQGLGLLAVEQSARPAWRDGPPAGRWPRLPRSGAGGRAGRGPCAPSAARRRRASCPAGRGRGSTGPCGPGRGRRPGRRPRHAGDRRGAAGRRPAPSARAAPPARRRRPRRRSSRSRTARAAGGRRARRPSRPRRATRAAGPATSMPREVMPQDPRRTALGSMTRAWPRAPDTPGVVSYPRAYAARTGLHGVPRCVGKASGVQDVLPDATARTPLPDSVGARATARSVRASHPRGRRRSPSPSPRRGEGARRADEGVPRRPRRAQPNRSASS